MKARLVPLYFTEANKRERQEFEEQIVRLRQLYGDVRKFCLKSMWNHFLLMPMQSCSLS